MKISQSALILTILRDASPDRLQRAINGLNDRTLDITLTHDSEDGIRAFVRNGDGKEYGVTLTESVSACSCRDAMYRGANGIICKHAAAVALYVLRSPQPKIEAPVPQFPTFHLMWRDGLVLCGDPHATKVQMWPWTEGMLRWPEVCPSCATAYHHPMPAPSISLPAPDLSLAKARPGWGFAA
jgi:hypothetical protein